MGTVYRKTETRPSPSGAKVVVRKGALTSGNSRTLKPSVPAGSTNAATPPTANASAGPGTASNAISHRPSAFNTPPALSQPLPPPAVGLQPTMVLVYGHHFLPYSLGQGQHACEDQRSVDRIPHWGVLSCAGNGCEKPCYAGKAPFSPRSVSATPRGPRHIVPQRLAEHHGFTRTREIRPFGI